MPATKEPPVTNPHEGFEVFATDRQTNQPYHWRKLDQTPEAWAYQERINFHNDTGYSPGIMDRVRAAAENAFTSRRNPRMIYERLGAERKDSRGQPTGESTYENLPEFDRDNYIEVTVRIVRKPA